MASIPLPALAVKEQPSPIDTYIKGMQLRQMQQQQALYPGQQQAQQQQIQAGGIDLQQKQIQLKDQQLLSDIYKSHVTRDNSSATPSMDGAASAKPQPTGVDWGGIYQDAITKGVSPNGLNTIIAAQKNQLDISEKIATLDKSGREKIQANNQSVWDAAETIRQIPEGSPERATAYASSIANLQQQGVDTSKFPQQVPDNKMLDQIEAPLGMVNGAVKLATEKAARLETEAKATKAQQDIAPPTKDQLDTFTTKTLPSFTNVTTAQRASFAQQASQARTIPEFNKVAETADATDKTMQMHADSLAQTKAMVGNKFGEAGLTANEKLWTDPAKGYMGVLAQANQTKQSIVAGADGNGLLTALVPTMEVLGVNHAAGISRISPQEAMAAGTPPDWATRWNAWAQKAGQGKLSPELAKQGQQLMDIVTNSAYNRVVASSQMVAKGHGIDPSQVPAMTKDGSITTLDKVSTGAAGSGGGKIVITAPDGSKHPFDTQAQADKFKQLANIK